MLGEGFEGLRQGQLDEQRGGRGVVVERGDERLDGLGEQVVLDLVGLLEVGYVGQVPEAELVLVVLGRVDVLQHLIHLRILLLIRLLLHHDIKLMQVVIDAQLCSRLHLFPDVRERADIMADVDYLQFGAGEGFVI